MALPGEVPSAAPPVPERPQYRWRSRLAAAARVLVVLLAASGGFVLESVAVQEEIGGFSNDFHALRAVVSG